MPKKTMTTSASILGLGLVPKASKPAENCVVCGKAIPKNRIEALALMRVAIENYTHVGCSTTTKVKGIFLGETGTSKLQVCNKVYDDSVRSVFRKSEVESGDNEEVDNDE